MERIWHAVYEKGIRPHLEYPRITLSEMLHQTAAKYPQHISMIYLDYKWTYTKLNEMASQMANLLIARGVRPGDAVGIHLPNCPQFVIAYYGVLRAGAVTVPVNPLFTGDDLGFILTDSKMKAIVTSCELLPALEVVGNGRLKIFVTDIRTPFGPGQEYEAPAYAERLEKGLFAMAATDPGLPQDPDALANLQYTGGTTGRSKGAMLSHANMMANNIQFRHWFSNIYEDGDGRFVCVIPLFHIYGMTTSMNGPVLSGSTMLIMAKFDINELMRIIDKYKPNLFMGVPAMYGAIAMREGHNYDLSSIKACVSGSAPLPSAIKEKFEQITGGKLVEGYGLSEASPIVCINPILGKVKTGSIGVPISDTDIKIIDPETKEEILEPGIVGELVVKGPQVMQGYWGRSDETELVLKDGWLRTGDLVSRDEEGYIYIADRLKDMIIMGGEKIYPRELEDLLYTHPAVREVAVIGVPHPLRGEVPKAYVALKEGAAATEKELKNFCAERLSKFKVPKIEFIDALPRNSVGKVLRRMLQERVMEEQKKD